MPAPRMRRERAPPSRTARERNERGRLGVPFGGCAADDEETSTANEGRGGKEKAAKTRCALAHQQGDSRASDPAGRKTKGARPHPKIICSLKAAPLRGYGGGQESPERTRSPESESSGAAAARQEPRQRSAAKRLSGDHEGDGGAWQGRNKKKAHVSSAFFFMFRLS